MQAIPPKPVKFFVAALFSDPKRLDQACALLEKQFGATDLISVDFSFDVTDYYHTEMGRPIWRRLLAFQPLRLPDDLAPSKIRTNQIEIDLADEGRRRVNLDVGYVDFDKVVLASAKYGIHKIYLAQGIYADLALHYEKGRLLPYPWAFPDFRSELYHPFFLNLRTLYKAQIKAYPQAANKKGTA